MAGLLPVVGAGSALAQCARPTIAGGGVFDLIPLASGTAVSSIIATISSVNTSSLAQSTALVSTPPNPAPDSQGGGRWGRVIAGTVETENTTTTTATIPVAGTVSCQATTKLDFVGTQAGMDIGKYNFANGGNIHWGFTTGYFDVSAKDKTPGIETFSSDNQIPFAGLYLALSSGNFSIDAQVRGDFYHMELSDVDQGMFNQPITARGVAFLWNASYRFDLPNRWFIEPSIGGVSSRTDIDQIDVAGGINVPLQFTPSDSSPGSVNVRDVNSLLGRASVRIGTTFVDGKLAWQPFVTGSVFREFAGDVRTEMTALTTALSATSSTSREGTFGHVGVGLAGVILDTGWLGYIRGDYRFGDNIEGISVNAGLRYQFTPAASMAGSTKDGGGYSAPTSFNWTGFYGGWSSGALWGDQEFVYSVPGSSDPKHQGYLLGGQLGYNWQIGHTVLGIEADYNWSNAEGGSRTGFNPFFSVGGGIESIGFLTGRVGYAHERALYYVKGGLAFGEVNAFAKDNLDAVRVLATPVVSSTDTQTGWAFGVGMEYALTDAWSVRGEWMHYDLGSATFPIQNPITADVDTRGNVARVGVNYHFGNRGHDYGHEPMK